MPRPLPSQERLCDLVIPPTNSEEQVCLEVWSDDSAPAHILTWVQFTATVKEITQQLNRASIPSHSALAIVVMPMREHTVINTAFLVPAIHAILGIDCSFCPALPETLGQVIDAMSSCLSGILLLGGSTLTDSDTSYYSFSNCPRWSHPEIRLLTPIAGFPTTIFPGIAYHIFTSGSTGQAKLTRVPHACIRPNIEDLYARFPLFPPSALVSVAPITFDPAVVEIYLALTSHARLILPTTNLRSRASAFGNMLVKSGTCFLQCTPSFLLGLGRDVCKHFLSPASPLRWVVLGGEPVPPLATLKSLQMVGNTTEWYTIYGVTEVSCWATVGLLEEDDKHNKGSFLGEVMKDTIVKLAEDSEILLGRECNNGQVMCEVAGKSYELYPTGDLGCFGTTGKLFFLGRKDRIVKRWGAKVNLTLLESVIVRLPTIDQCCCSFENVSGVLTALISGSLHDGEAVQKAVLNQLGTTYVPTRINFVNQMPTSRHGKAEFREALIKGSAVTDTISNLWFLYLNRRPLSGQSKWLEDGGDSIGALALSTSVQDALNAPKAVVLEALMTVTFDEVCTIVEDSTFKLFSKNICSKNMQDIMDKPHKRKRKFSHLESFLSCCDQYYSLSSQQHSIRAKSCLIDVDLNITSLEVTWKYSLGKCIDASVLAFISNTVEDDLTANESCLLIGSHSRWFVALRPHDGSKIWSTELPDRIEASASLSLCSRYVLIGCYDGCLYSLCRRSGKIEWCYRTDGQIKTTPCIAGSLAIFGSHDGAVHAVNACAKRGVWLRHLDGTGIVSSPAIHSKRIYAATLKSGIFCLSVETGDVVWQTQLEAPVFASLLVCPTESLLVIGCCDTHVYGISIDDQSRGQVVWKFATGAPIFSSPTLTNFSSILIGSHDGALYVINLTSGSGRQLTRRDTPVYSSPTALTNSGHLFGVCADVGGSLFLVDCQSSPSRIICEHSFPGEVFSSPVLVGNSVVIGCRDDHLYSLRLCS